MKAQTRYAKSGTAHIAYRVFGDGPRDIVVIPGTISHVELFWELPNREHLLKRLTAFARVIVFDKRGQGLSGRVGDHTLEERIGDVRAVMDAAGSQSATIYGWSEGGPMCLTFAATYPGRTSALVLFGSFASMRADPWELTPEQFELLCSQLDAHWGEGALLPLVAPSRSNDSAFVESFGRLERSSTSPGSIVALMRANYDIDVRYLLPSIHVPTLILHRSGDTLIPVAAGRYLADHIPGAKYVELPGSDHMVVDQETEDVIADEIEEFITGAHRRLEPDGVLATVMFTDIVGSTARAAQVGDKRWRELLAAFYAVVGKELSAFRGRQVNTAGDGVLATFDGPARAIRCACAVHEKLATLGLQARSGLHTGECELIGDDIGGIAVHIGARVAAAAGANEVLVSSTVRDLVAGSGIQFDDLGTHALKGVPGEWRLFRALNLQALKMRVG
jgi:class 3 adenylate cyclase